MAKKMKQKIANKVIELTRQVYFEPPTDGFGLCKQFTSGEHPPWDVRSGRIIKWWITQKGLSACRDIGDMAISHDPSLTYGDVEAFPKIIEEALEIHVDDRDLFRMNDIFLGDVDTLFDGRAIEDPREFASKLFDKIHKHLHNSISSWLILYPLHRISTKTTTIGYDGLSLLDSLLYAVTICAFLNVWKRRVKNERNSFLCFV
jgi:hypothetical protein